MTIIVTVTLCAEGTSRDVPYDPRLPAYLGGDPPRLDRDIRQHPAGRGHPEEDPSVRHVASAPVCFFFFNDTATTEIYTLSLHDALPILKRRTTPSSRSASRSASARES